MSRRKHFIAILSIIALSFIIYGNSLNNGFVYDDYDTIVNNTLIKDLLTIPKLINKSDYFRTSGELSYRPVVTLTYFIDYAIFGLKPWGYHLTSILLHAANGAMLYIITCMLFPATGERFLDNRPLIISLLFASNPILTEAVNGISYREDLLVFFFYASTLILYSFKKKPLYVLSCATYLIALFSKEMAVTFPLVIYTYEAIYNRKKSINSYNLGYIAITLIYLYVRFFYFQNPEEGHPPTWPINQRLMTVPWIVLNELKMSLFPFSLSADYVIDPVKSVFDARFIVPTISIIILIATLHKTDMFLGISIFFITLMPVYNISRIATPIAERYLYLPAAGIAIVLGLFLCKCRFKTLPLFVAILLIFSVQTEKRNYTWKDDYQLWKDTVKKMPNSGIAHNNLGVEMAIKNEDIDKRIEEFKKAIEVDKKTNYNARMNLAKEYAKKRMYQEALTQNYIALRDPNVRGKDKNEVMAEIERIKKLSQSINNL